MTQIRHELTDKECGRFYKKHGIDTRKNPPTKEELFTLIRDVFKAGSEIDVVHLKWKE
jgi:hypothetical protein